ncbi:MAG: helix-turn-helix transcriptional regulator [Candidatus Aenigmarchaeota archaeon]|nr:helix-turn-helix transcriptional regulator [Candidatus Aenigmarchaeota archaeon]
MPKKRGFGPDKYKIEILNVLRKYPFMSTSEICDNLNMGYETGLKYIEQLSKEGKIKHRKIGNRQFWYI